MDRCVDTSIDHYFLDDFLVYSVLQGLSLMSPGMPTNSRSFGVGSSVVLSSPFPPVTTFYSYQEIGYNCGSNVRTINHHAKSFSPSPFKLPNKDLITRIVTHKINNLGSVLSSTQWTSVIGDTMTRNIRTVKSVRGARNASALLGVSTALDSVLDSFLEALSAAQLQILDSSDSAIVETESAAFVFGAPIYIYAILTITLAITLVYIGELAWTKALKDVPAFNFINIDDVIVAASKGGNTLASKANKISAEGSINNIAVTLHHRRDYETVALTVADSHAIDGTGYQVCSNEDNSLD